MANTEDSCSKIKRRSSQGQSPTSPSAFTKRQRLSPSQYYATDEVSGIRDEAVLEEADVHYQASLVDNTNPIQYWTKEFRWPKEYFVPHHNMLVSESSSSPLRSRQWEDWNSGPSSAIPNDQRPTEAKRSRYLHPGYAILLAAKGSFMHEVPELRITTESKMLCQTLLTTEQPIPEGTLFDDDIFEATCSAIHDRNEAMVVRDISPLICPSAQVLAIKGAKHLKILTESVNEDWDSAIPFCGPSPQPDYSVGFGRSAFTQSQIGKLTLFTKELMDDYTSYFMSTWYMYFPFLTCEVESGAGNLEVADRQNAHSMTIAVRAIVELFKLVKREHELHREILAFSISHSDSSVRIYGHYAALDGANTTFYRHDIHSLCIAGHESKEKWLAYTFVRNVYDIWMPNHWKRICAVIDQLPEGINFALSDLGSSELALGTPIDASSNQSTPDLTAMTAGADHQSRDVSMGITSATSTSQADDGGAVFKKARTLSLE
ncbi:hypothetical protein ACMFMG_003229 [Clarireedia jacksonii]